MLGGEGSCFIIYFIKQYIRQDHPISASGEKNLGERKTSEIVILGKDKANISWK